MLPSRRTCVVALMQTGPASAATKRNVRTNLQMLNQLSRGVNFVVFPELSTTPYWVTGEFERKYFRYAESLDGPTVKRFAERARALRTYVVLPFFEKGDVEGEYFNTAVLIAPDGQMVRGTLPNGSVARCYRKNHLSKEQFGDLVLDEVSYMRPGFGFPIFDTAFGRVGILICRDRWFPESWRMLTLQGAELILIATASMASLKDLFVSSMRTWARENQVFAAIANKVGTERLDRAVRYCGSSCVVGPDGSVLAVANDEKPQGLVAKFDIAEVARVRQELPNYRDRRPELYQKIVEPR